LLGTTEATFFKAQAVAEEFVNEQNQTKVFF